MVVIFCPNANIPGWNYLGPVCGGLTAGVLLADVPHQPHEAVADALFVGVLAHGDARPVCLLIAALLVKQLATLWTSENRGV